LDGNSRSYISKKNYSHTYNNFEQTGLSHLSIFPFAYIKIFWYEKPRVKFFHLKKPKMKFALTSDKYNSYQFIISIDAGGQNCCCNSDDYHSGWGLTQQSPIVVEQLSSLDPVICIY